MEKEHSPSGRAITKVEALKMANARACFAAKLNWLGSPQARGFRNQRLCSVARCGLNCGLPPAEVAEAMQEAGGTVQPLTEAECRRAVDTVLAARAPEWRRRAAADWSVVPEMIRIGQDGRVDETFEELVRQSQEACGIARLSPREQAETMLDALGGGLRFFCNDAAEPRTHLVAFDGRLPQRVTLNSLTGRMGHTKAGKPSLVCDETASSDNWLIEFDGLPLADQMNWLAGNVSEFQRGNPAAFDVVTGVHSGGKSMHFAVRRTSREALERYAPQADHSVWHPSTLTRLAGAVRPETGQLQRLVYCAR